MDTEILFPEINLFRSNKVSSLGKKSRDSAAPKISKAKRRKIRCMKMKNSMVSSSLHINSNQPEGDGSYLLLDNNGAEANSLALAGVGDGSPALLDSNLLLPTIGYAPPVVNFVDSPVVLAAVQPQSTMPHYNLRPRVSRLL